MSLKIVTPKPTSLPTGLLPTITVTSNSLAPAANPGLASRPGFTLYGLKFPSDISFCTIS